MNYKIKRCRICNKRIHVHNKRNKHGHVLKNTCKHIPNDKDKTFTDKELKNYLKEYQH